MTREQPDFEISGKFEEFSGTVHVKEGASFRISEVDKEIEGLLQGFHVHLSNRSTFLLHEAQINGQSAIFPDPQAAGPGEDAGNVILESNGIWDLGADSEPPRCMPPDEERCELHPTHLRITVQEGGHLKTAGDPGLTTELGDLILKPGSSMELEGTVLVQGELELHEDVTLTGTGGSEIRLQGPGYIYGGVWTVPLVAERDHGGVLHLLPRTPSTMIKFSEYRIICSSCLSLSILPKPRRVRGRRRRRRQRRRMKNDLHPFLPPAWEEIHSLQNHLPFSIMSLSPMLHFQQPTLDSSLVTCSGKTDSGLWIFRMPNHR